MPFPKEIRYKTVTLEKAGEEKFILHDGEETIIINPYKNTRHVIEYYKWLATEAPIEELRAFAIGGFYEKYPLIMNRRDLYQLQIDGLFKPIPEEEITELAELAQDPFFSQMCLDNKIPINCLETYAIAKAEVRAFKELPDIDTSVLKSYWLYQEDYIELYRGLGFERLVAEVYDIKGYKWFCEEAWNDPVRYKWALNALLAKKHCCNNENEINKLKEDLFNLYEDILLSAANFKNINDMKDVLKPIKEALSHWEDEKIESAIEELNKLKDINLQLTNDYQKLKEKYDILQKQVQNLQMSDKLVDEKIDEIIFRIYCATQPNISDEKFKSKFEDIWDKLSDESKKDIYSSITLFNSFNSAVDLAILPLIRSLEREFSIHFFDPFKNSKHYVQCSNYECLVAKYRLTHEALLRGKSPTMGNIPFIARAINDKKALEASKVIESFGKFLGSKKDAFINICKHLDMYRIGIMNYKLVDIRNGIAHGNGEITRNIDENSYIEISKMFFEPPLQILFKVVQNSMKQ